MHEQYPGREQTRSCSCIVKPIKIYCWAPAAKQFCRVSAETGCSSSLGLHSPYACAASPATAKSCAQGQDALKIRKGCWSEPTWYWKLTRFVACHVPLSCEAMMMKSEPCCNRSHEWGVYSTLRNLYLQSQAVEITLEKIHSCLCLPSMREVRENMMVLLCGLSV